MALADHCDSGYVADFLSGCAPSIVKFFVIVLADPKLVVTAEANCFAQSGGVDSWFVDVLGIPFLPPSLFGSVA